MKKIIDKYEIKKLIDKDIDEVKSSFVKKVLNSQNLVLSSKKDHSNLEIVSKEREWMMFPILPKFNVRIKFIELEANKSEIQAIIKGNSIVKFFKYVVIFIGVVWGLAFFLLDFQKEYGLIFIPFTSIFHFLLLNFWNRSHIKKGVFQISQLIP